MTPNDLIAVSSQTPGNVQRSPFEWLVSKIRRVGFDKDNKLFGELIHDSDQVYHQLNYQGEQFVRILSDKPLLQNSSPIVLFSMSPKRGKTLKRRKGKKTYCSQNPIYGMVY